MTSPQNLTLEDLNYHFKALKWAAEHREGKQMSEERRQTGDEEEERALCVCVLEKGKNTRNKKHSKQKLRRLSSEVCVLPTCGSEGIRTLQNPPALKRMWRTWLHPGLLRGAQSNMADEIKIRKWSIYECPFKRKASGWKNSTDVDFF